mgnify:CR=1 FL=1
MKKIMAIAALMFAAALAAPFASAEGGEAQRLKIDGAVGKLSAVIQKPTLAAGRKCPMVMLLHGFMGGKTNRPLTDIADALEKEGIASIRFDFNGHGESEGDFQSMTVLNEIEDAKRVFAYVRALDYVESVSVAGHSQGGVVSSMLAGEFGQGNIKSLVLLAPAAVLRDDAIRGRIFNTVYDAANPPEVVPVFGDFKMGRAYILAAQTLPIYETAQKYAGPVCLVHGTGDRVVPYTYSERYHSLYRDSELHLLDGADHNFNNFEAETTAIAVAFLKKHTKAE